MISRWLMVSIAVLAMLMVSSASDPVDAHGVHHHGGGGGSYNSYRYSGGGGNYVRRHHHRGYIFLGVPYYYGDYYYYGDGCYWLKRRALYTGSRYWWNRYYACIGY